ncbi:hypothetical protein [Cellulomonas sp. C5510]|uniref:hypothetical protein n=1 Tax=Cellulomonas sp. C5510 TaxID=2871170 RepID=UPI001C958FDF|nr:hypothetical protein [Cellulomonas sp. C5510]QZN85470.1 hypothetical protein K5O09_17225 [Cellulomonas sp. C5510]
MPPTTPAPDPAAAPPEPPAPSERGLRATALVALLVLALAAGGGAWLLRHQQQVAHEERALAAAQEELGAAVADLGAATAAGEQVLLSTAGRVESDATRAALAEALEEATALGPGPGTTGSRAERAAAARDHARAAGRRAAEVRAASADAAESSAAWELAQAVTGLAAARDALRGAVAPAAAALAEGRGTPGQRAALGAALTGAESVLAAPVDLADVDAVLAATREADGARGAVEQAAGPLHG